VGTYVLGLHWGKDGRQRGGLDGLKGEPWKTLPDSAYLPIEVWLFEGLGEKGVIVEGGIRGSEKAETFELHSCRDGESFASTTGLQEEEWSESSADPLDELQIDAGECTIVAGGDLKKKAGRIGGLRPSSEEEVIR